MKKVGQKVSYFFGSLTRHLFHFVVTMSRGGGINIYHNIIDKGIKIENNTEI